MPHIALTSTEPGDPRVAARYRPQTARPLGELTEVLLRGPGTLTRGERGTDRGVCVGAQRLPVLLVVALGVRRRPAAGGALAVVEQIRGDPATAPVSAKLKALLAIAAAVARSGRAVTTEHIDREAPHSLARRTWKFHDTVLIAANVLHVQPVRRWPVATTEPDDLRRSSTPSGRSA